MGLIDHRFEDNFITTSIDRVLNWARESSIWPMGRSPRRRSADRAEHKRSRLREKLFQKDLLLGELRRMDPNFDVSRLRTAVGGAQVLTGNARGSAEYPGIERTRTALIPVR